MPGENSKPPSEGRAPARPKRMKATRLPLATRPAEKQDAQERVPPKAPHSRSERPKLPDAAALPDADAVRIEQLVIAQKLHNTACQTLSGARFFLSSIERSLPREFEKLRPDLRTLEKQLRRASDELHELIKRLRPA
jgi:signal transduction histidine kinase